jgi:hypothetical protein
MSALLYLLDGGVLQTIKSPSLAQILVEWLVLHTLCVVQTMYSSIDENDPKSELVLDDLVTGGYDDEGETDLLLRWRVAPNHTRPWHLFEEANPVWPVPELRSLSNGVPSLAALGPRRNK